MNDVIEVLLKEKEDQERKLATLNYKIRNLEECISKEMFKETQLLNKVLKYNIVDIIEMIHKRKLKCAAIRNAETIWGDTVYKVSDGTYFANIIAKDGTIVMDLSDIDNDGGGQCLYNSVKILINNDIIPYCRQNKEKYIDKVKDF